jgi:hypothetical protein
MNIVRCYLLALAILPTLSFAVPPLDPAQVPEPLRPWIDWVTFKHPDFNCPFLYNNVTAKRCAWPGHLQLNLGADGGRFEANWQVFSDSWITLPGNREMWPQTVRLDGRTVILADRGGRPALHVGAGSYRIEGRFQWDRVPESLTIPHDSGLVRLRVNDREIQRPEIDRNGRIWLRDLESGRATADDADKNRVTLTVLRRVVDDNPLELYTRIEFDVTGDQREQAVGLPLLEGFIPVDIVSVLPTRLEPDGRLSVQLRPGRHVVTLRARSPEPTTEIKNTEQPAPWPSMETWVFEARNHLRVVEIDGVPAVDPRQTRVPEEWRQLPAFAVAGGDAMKLLETRRGNPDPEPDKLSLERELWLDFDGGGYTTHDRITGQITRNWRLDSSAALDLGQVVIDGQPQFITRLREGRQDGVEVRRGKVDLGADGRMDGDIDHFAATGWAHDFQSVKATLRLPPGWDVFAIGGVDNIPDSWLTRCTLLDLFMVLVVTAAVLRLWHWQAAVIALLTTVLIWHAPDAPRYVWIHLLIAIALLRVLPPGRFRWLIGSYRNVSALVLILICIPFVVHQLRTATYPQLGQHAYYAKPAAAAIGGAMIAEDNVAVMDESSEMELAFADEMVAHAPMEPASVLLKQRGVRSSVEPKKKIAALYGLDPNAIVQTGPGLPTWRWREVNLNWNGPVDRAQELSISYVSPVVNAILNIARVALLLAFLTVVFGLSTTQLLALTRRGSAAALTLLVVSALAYAPHSRAVDFPEPAMLEELKQRLIAPPECAKRCADITRMRVDIGDVRDRDTPGSACRPFTVEGFERAR